MNHKNKTMTETGSSSQESDAYSLEIVIGIYVLIFAFKLIVYFMTGVMALFAEALHTLSDIFISSFLLVALIWSRKEADEVHMFGYGRVQNVAALVGTLFIMQGQYIADPIASIIVATIIAYNAVGLFRENLSFLPSISGLIQFMLGCISMCRKERPLKKLIA